MSQGYIDFREWKEVEIANPIGLEPPQTCSLAFLVLPGDGCM